MPAASSTKHFGEIVPRTSQGSFQLTGVALAADGGLPVPDPVDHGARGVVAVARRETSAQHSRVHLIHDPLALHRRDGQVPGQAARLGVHESGDRVHGVQQERRVQMEEILPDGGHGGVGLVRDDGRHVSGHRAGRVERPADQGGGHGMPVRPGHLGV